MAYFVYKKDLDELQDSVDNRINILKDDLNCKVQKLQSDINHRVTDSEEVAKQSAESAKIHENTALKTVSQIEGNAAAIEEIRITVEGVKQKILNEQELAINSNLELKKKIDETIEVYSSIIDAKSTANNAVEQIQVDIAKISKYLSESQELPGLVDKTKSLAEQSNTSLTNANELLNHVIAKKSEIDDIHKKIFGTDVLKEDGVTEHIDGLKDQLDSSYKRISENIKTLNSTLDEKTSEITKKHEEYQALKETEFSKLVNNSNTAIESIKKQLSDLLPGAMAAGLSAAYEDKKDKETKALGDFEKNFRSAILGMVVISLIPFAVDVYLLGWKSHELVGVIKNTPSLIVSILPLYFPVLWLAYSSNKRINLSKRLIEEYTHKSVLGKTFSGLAEQIESLPHEGKLKEELRTNLLFNVLQVSAENPGKLITDYQKSDHPLMDALEKSAKLSDAVESISKIPGFNSFAKKLAEKSDQLFMEQSKKVEEGLEINSALEAKVDQEN